MADVEKSISQLIAALHERGARNEAIAEAVGNIRQHMVDLHYSNEADKERVVLDVFALGRTKAFLQSFLGTNSLVDEHQIIQRSIHEIDTHFRMNNWPTDVSDDDPVLLKQLWRQQNVSLSAAERLTDCLLYTSPSPRD